jgi:hypothetical protein
VLSFDREWATAAPAQPRAAPGRGVRSSSSR